MDSTANPESQSPQPPSHQEAYIGKEPLRLLARLIAKDILHRKAGLNSGDKVPDSSPQPEKAATGKEGDPQP